MHARGMPASSRWPTGIRTHPTLVNARFTMMASHIVELIVLRPLMMGHRLWNELARRVPAGLDGNGRGAGCLVGSQLEAGRRRRRHEAGGRCGPVRKDEVVEIHGFRAVDIVLRRLSQLLSNAARGILCRLSDEAVGDEAKYSGQRCDRHRQGGGIPRRGLINAHRTAAGERCGHTCSAAAAAASSFVAPPPRAAFSCAC